MPHLIVEYSANLERDVDIPRLVAAVHAAALETGVFPIGGIRTRAERRDIYQVADSHRRQRLHPCAGAHRHRPVAGGAAEGGRAYLRRREGGDCQGIRQAGRWG